MIKRVEANITVDVDAQRVRIIFSERESAEKAREAVLKDTEWRDISGLSTDSPITREEKERLGIAVLHEVDGMYQVHLPLTAEASGAARNIARAILTVQRKGLLVNLPVPDLGNTVDKLRGIGVKSREELRRELAAKKDAETKEPQKAAEKPAEKERKEVAPEVKPEEKTSTFSSTTTDSGVKLMGPERGGVARQDGEKSSNGKDGEGGKKKKPGQGPNTRARAAESEEPYPQPRTIGWSGAGAGGRGGRFRARDHILDQADRNMQWGGRGPAKGPRR